MGIETLREKLHEYIDVADEQHLSAIFVLVGDDIPSLDEEKYDEATLKMFYERRDNHLNGTSRSYTVEEAMNMISQPKK